ncbi:MAG: hypothetical protein AB8H12_00075 [Lewinella sp.]
MATVTISDPNQLKEVVLDVLRENPELLKAAVKELLAPKGDPEAETPEARKERMRALIQDDFDRYEDVFKALA